MEGLLPQSIIYRPKTGFGAPIRHWIRNEFRPRIDDALSAPALRARGLFNPTAVAKLIRDDRVGRIDGAYNIFALLCVELWCRLFVDRTAG